VPRFPSLAPTGSRSPASAVLSRHYDFLTPIPPRFVSFAWWYLGGTRYVRSSTDEYSRRSLELFTRYSSRDFAEETTGSPKFLENPYYPFAHVLRLRQDCLHQTK
jgi:hypothetical protein